MHPFSYRNGALHAEDVALAAIVEAVGTPFYCYSSAAIARNRPRVNRAKGSRTAAVTTNLATVTMIGGHSANAHLANTKFSPQISMTIRSRAASRAPGSPIDKPDGRYWLNHPRLFPARPSPLSRPAGEISAQQPRAEPVEGAHEGGLRVPGRPPLPQCQHPLSDPHPQLARRPVRERDRKHASRVDAVLPNRPDEALPLVARVWHVPALIAGHRRGRAVRHELRHVPRVEPAQRHTFPGQLGEVLVGHDAPLVRTW